MESELEIQSVEASSRAARKQALQDGFARSMFIRAGVGTGATAAGLLFCAAGASVMAALCLGAAACFFIAGAWSAIQRDCVEERLGGSPS